MLPSSKLDLSINDHPPNFVYVLLSRCQPECLVVFGFQVVDLNSNLNTGEKPMPVTQPATTINRNELLLALF